MSNTTVSNPVVAKPMILGYTLSINGQPIVTIVTSDYRVAKLYLSTEPYKSILGDVEVFDFAEILWEDVREEVQYARMKKLFGVEGMKPIAFIPHPKA